MAIYHFSAKVISRAAGSSALASAAYRSASRLHDQRLDRHHDFTNKSGVVHSEVLLPEHAPHDFADRERLWNAVETVEVRKDAQLAREVEFAIPREMSEAQGIALACDFVEAEFVERGMIADLNVHCDIGADGLAKPHAHVMLTMREVSEDGFGPKNRDWNRTELLTGWRERWADHVNERLAELDIDTRIDHRSLEAQGISLEPQHKIGPAASRRLERGDIAERAEDHLRIARENGAKIIADPQIALDAMTHSQATFTREDMLRFLHRHTEGQEQFEQARAAMRGCPELVQLGQDGRGQTRFTSRDMIAVEERLTRAADALAKRCDHGVALRHRDAALTASRERGLTLSGEQRDALLHVTGKEGLASVVGYAGSGKSAMLGVAREAWEASGYQVRGAALSGIAAENLEGGSGIAARTIASLEHQWGQGRELLAGRDVLVIDEAGMVGSRQLARVLTEAEKRGAKVVLVGDPQQLQAIEAGAAFRCVAERHGAVEIGEVRRQREDWQRDATRQLATGRTGEALAAYEQHGAVHHAVTRAAARNDLIGRWDRERAASPDESRIILTHTNDEVRALNIAARKRLRGAGELGDEVTLATERGERSFAPGDRVMFLRNERDMDVKNGSLATIEQINPERMAARLDDGRHVAFDLKDYAHIDHGYAATIHKAQGMTVDRAHVLATPGLDRHAAYVALSRHRTGIDLHYGRDDFASTDKLVRTLSRDRAKDMATDYTPERADEYGRAFAERRSLAGDIRNRLEDGWKRFKRTVIEHARSVSDIFRAGEQGRAVSPEQSNSLAQRRAALDAFDPNHSRDIERAYKADPALAHKTASGRTARAIRALQLEGELRQNAPARADRFVADWRKLDSARETAYRQGNMTGMKRITAQMGGMAKSLERDPQLESLLAGRKQQLGISIGMGRSLGRELATSIGFDWGRGRGLGR
ncbi:MAG: Ti-type conjugative transfer relaxase TraA [Qipengyuania citrea]|uniref:Ti-type conjugative transfer relaxase TraA n=1 Tax=Qipengyuania citrea TaxID=225971 RepID=UPI0032665B09